MHSTLSDSDREIVKRAVPKSANKIHAVAVVRLYIAYPNRQRWNYTGLQGAAVLANDLVGNTYWIKLVDVSVRILCLAMFVSSLTKLRAPIVGSSGIKRYTIHFITTRIELSSIPSNLKTALLGSPLQMRKKPKSSSRRWRTEKRMQAKARKLHLFRAKVCNLRGA